MTRAKSDGEGRVPYRRDAPIVAHNSKPKLVLLAIPCIAAMLVGIGSAVTGAPFLGGGLWNQLAVAAIGGFTAFVLLQMAFDRKPVLVIDEDGITCRRPDTGLIPWDAVVGLGTSKATLIRRVLMIAVNTDALEDKARSHVRNRSGLFAAFSPQVAKFEGQMAGFPTIHVSLSYFDLSTVELERQLAEKIKYHG